ncbi:MAG: hypothetical protein FJX47_18595 [Alphaproteobacteria bacterium]|nr:hypothetical protein [Alphaproteobacteria bacterium]
MAVAGVVLRIVPTAIMAGLMALAASLALAQDRRVALVVANGRYAHAPALANPSNDGRGVTEALKRLGFHVTEAHDVNRMGMEFALRSFRRGARQADMALVFYAGHAIQVGGRNHLLPVDAKLADEDDLNYETVPLDLVLSAVEGASKVRVVILDSCRDNPFGNKLAQVMGTRRSAGVGRGLAVTAVGGGNTLIAYATRDGLIADDGKGKHSPYTAALLRHMEEPGLDLNQLFGKVRDTVLAATGGKQQPFVYGSLGGERFFLKAPDDAGAVAPSASAPPDPAATELAYWSSVQDSQYPAEYDAYLSRYPQGQFAELARARLSALRPKPDLPERLTRPIVGNHELAPGRAFRDCRNCPEMVIVPAGRFTMGSPDDEPDRDADEGPQREVSVRSFALGKTEITFAQYDACVAERDCPRAADNNWGRGDQPVINVSWDDAKAYSAWLGRKSRTKYRLPSEAEWEYAARAGTGTRFSCGGGDACLNQVAWHGSNSGNRAQPVATKAANEFGLHDMHGNVWEWVEDCWNKTYDGAPSGVNAWIQGDCTTRVLRGGSWGNSPKFLRSAYRLRGTAVIRYNINGFRVARSLD